jgi:hypothetical protein
MQVNAEPNSNTRAVYHPVFYSIYILIGLGKRGPYKAVF